MAENLSLNEIVQKVELFKKLKIFFIFRYKQQYSLAIALLFVIGIFFYTPLAYVGVILILHLIIAFAIANYKGKRLTKIDMLYYLASNLEKATKSDVDSKEEIISKLEEIEIVIKNTTTERTEGEFLTRVEIKTSKELRKFLDNCIRYIQISNNIERINELIEKVRFVILGVATAQKSSELYFSECAAFVVENAKIDNTVSKIREEEKLSFFENSHDEKELKTKKILDFLSKAAHLFLKITLILPLPVSAMFFIYYKFYLKQDFQIDSGIFNIFLVMFVLGLGLGKDSILFTKVADLLTKFGK